MKKRDKKTPSCYLLPDQEASTVVNTVFGNGPVGSILSYQLKDLKENAVTFTFDRRSDQVVAVAGSEIKASFPNLPA